MNTASLASNGTAPGRRVHFHCPGCEEVHGVTVDTPDGWGWNGDLERPTFTPSLLLTSGHYIDGWTGPDCWCTYAEKHPEHGAVSFRCRRCHSFVTDGRIQFLSDSTHALAGQTVDLPPWREDQG